MAARRENAKPNRVRSFALCNDFQLPGRKTPLQFQSHRRRRTTAKPPSPMSQDRDIERLAQKIDRLAVNAGRARAESFATDVTGSFKEMARSRQVSARRRLFRRRLRSRHVDQKVTVRRAPWRSAILPSTVISATPRTAL
jgi:hypothetical protein